MVPITQKHKLVLFNTVVIAVIQSISLILTKTAHAVYVATIIIVSLIGIIVDTP